MADVQRRQQQATADQARCGRAILAERRAMQARGLKPAPFTREQLALVKAALDEEAPLVQALDKAQRGYPAYAF